MTNKPESSVDYLFSPAAIRQRAEKVFQFTEDEKGFFVFHPEQLAPTITYVIEVIHQNYPDLKIPFHSRWGHFRVGGVDRVRELDSRLQSLEAKESARAKLDLVIPSVLLDAGAGTQWKFFEKETQSSYGRSEGLGVASLYLFLSGALAGDGRSLRADKEGLRNLSLSKLSSAFQVSEKNPLVGLEGRLGLLNNLARALENKTIFKNGRPGNILDYLMEKYGTQIPAPGILRAVLDGLGSIWPGRVVFEGKNMGDLWVHSKLGSPGTFESFVPFHKLSQWLTYSLIEPIQEAGCRVVGVEELTGLAEYRNGGLLLDSGLISLQDPANAQKSWEPGSELIIEWRALTVHLLDQIGMGVQKKLGMSPAQLPLAKVLEGGTWWAGRFLAQKKRADGAPPLRIQSDGTVF